MRKHKSSKDVKLLVDVVDYAFVEWLIRRKVYSAFRANYDRAFGSSKPFRALLRKQIRYLLGHSSLSPASLISSAFLFISAPEGYEFWIKQSEAWSQFYANFSKNV